MSEDKWKTFENTGKISDYLSFKGIDVNTNGDKNADANTDPEPQRTCYT